MAEFPGLRLRRLRRNEALRALVRETRVDVGDLIYPLFVVEGTKKKQEITSMPGQYRFSVDLLSKEAESIARLGIPAIILFGIPQKKDEVGSQAYHTSHGHCGVVVNGDVDNDKTLELLAKTALSHAQAGADMVAPSDMMDGRVKAIRQSLDGNGFENIPIMAYSAKYASAFFGPFREAAESAPQFGDRRSYQMDQPNCREAMREVEQDIAEGADIVMVKPALPYLDVIRRVRDTFNYPLAAYSVSGEYAMVKAAAQQGWLDEKKIVVEMLTAIKRAGADIILTYYAKEAASWL